MNKCEVNRIVRASHGCDTSGDKFLSSELDIGPLIILFMGDPHHIYLIDLKPNSI